MDPLYQDLVVHLSAFELDELTELVESFPPNDVLEAWWVIPPPEKGEEL